MDSPALLEHLSVPEEGPRESTRPCHMSPESYKQGTVSGGPGGGPWNTGWPGTYIETEA